MQGLGVLFPLSWKSAYEFSFCPLDPKFCILEFNQPHIMWYYSMYFMKNNLCTSGLLQFKLMLFMGQLYSTLFWKWSAFCKSNTCIMSKYSSFLHAPSQFYFYHLNYFFFFYFIHWFIKSKTQFTILLLRFSLKM